MSKPSHRVRGQIIPRGTNKWLVRVFIGRDPGTGKRVYTSQTIEGTRRDADRARVRLLAAVDSGEMEVSITLAEHLEEWLETVARPSVTIRTYQAYRRDLETYVIPKIGSARLKDLTTRTIQALYSDMDRRGLSPTTIRLAHAPLRQALETAVDWELIPMNPALGTRRPKIRRVERLTLTMEQVNNFLDTYQDDRYYALWVILLFAGLRPGEAVGLKWIDLRGARLAIRRAITEVEGRKWGVGDTKTRESIGVVTLPAIAVEALERHRKRQEEEIRMAGKSYEKQGWIFADKRGNFLRPDTASNYWRRLLKRAGLPAMRLYDTRHTHATLLLTAGVNPKIVSARLRHASVGITLDTYSHVLPEVDAGVADTLDEMLEDVRKAG